MSAGKRPARGPIQDDSDEEEGRADVPDKTWEPEEGGMFLLPITEFFTQRHQVPDKYKDNEDWQSELMEAKFMKKKRSNARGSQWSYGLDFKDGKPVSYYQDICEWQKHYVGVDLYNNAGDSDLESLLDATEEVDPPSGSSAGALRRAMQQTQMM